MAKTIASNIEKKTTGTRLEELVTHAARNLNTLEDLNERLNHIIERSEGEGHPSGDYAVEVDPLGSVSQLAHISDKTNSVIGEMEQRISYIAGII